MPHSCYTLTVTLLRAICLHLVDTGAQVCKSFLSCRDRCRQLLEVLVLLGLPFDVRLEPKMDLRACVPLCVGHLRRFDGGAAVVALEALVCLRVRDALPTQRLNLPLALLEQGSFRHLY